MKLLEQLLENYTVHNSKDVEMQSIFLNYIKEHSNALERSCLDGHFTASAFVVNEERTHVLLMHHKKFDVWIQFGGHCDGCEDTVKVAQKELEEESGIKEYALIEEGIFDLDIHEVPRYQNIKEHLHYDIRYLFEVPFDVSFQKEESEVNDIKWFAFEEALALEDVSLKKAVRKIQNL